MIGAGYEQQPLRMVIDAATTSLWCFAVTPLPIDALRALVRKADAGLTVVLIVPDNYAQKVGLTERYQQKFASAGGDFYAVSLSPQDWQRIGIAPRSLLLIDEQVVWQPTLTPSYWQATELAPVTVSRQFERLRDTGVRFIPDPSTQRSSPAPSTTRMPFVPIVKEEPPAPKQKIRAPQPLRLSFHLTADDPLGVRSPGRLESRSDMPGFYGCQRGATLMLYWRAAGARTVWIDDERVPLTGQRRLPTNGRIVRQLRAEGLEGNSMSERITINTFVAPEVPEEVLRVIMPLDEEQTNAAPAPETTANDSSGFLSIRQWFKGKKA